MVCEATGNPKPWVQWKRYETGRTMDGDTVMLRNISRLDAGMYVCTADNSVTQPVERVTKVVVRRKYHPSCDLLCLANQNHIVSNKTIKYSRICTRY